jgi:ribonuclease H2 subunit A
MPRKAQEDTAMAEPDSASTSAAPAACQFPSVKTDAPLVHSYTFHSADKEVAGSAKGKEVEHPAVEGEWMLGVDEAGRGPVLGELARFLSLGRRRADGRSSHTGPQVYGIAFCKLEYSDELKSLGFAGQVLATTRSALFRVAEAAPLQTPRRSRTPNARSSSK